MSQPSNPDFFGGIKIFEEKKSMLFFEAFLFLFLGIFAIISPFVFTLAVDFAIGIILIAGGCMQLYRTIQSWSGSGPWGALLLSVIKIAVGGLFLFQPAVGIVALTTLVAAYFLVEGCAKIYWAISLDKDHSLWLIISGVLSLILAGIIISGFPGTALWVIGVLIGVDFLFYSFFLFQIGSSLKEKERIEK